MYKVSYNPCKPLQYGTVLYSLLGIGLTDLQRAQLKTSTDDSTPSTFGLTKMAGPAPLIVPALKKHTATILWAHGLGDRCVFTTLLFQEDFR